MHSSQMIQAMYWHCYLPKFVRVYLSASAYATGMLLNLPELEVARAGLRSERSGRLVSAQYSSGNGLPHDPRAVQEVLRQAINRSKGETQKTRRRRRIISIVNKKEVMRDQRGTRRKKVDYHAGDLKIWVSTTI